MKHTPEQSGRYDLPTYQFIEIEPGGSVTFSAHERLVSDEETARQHRLESILGVIAIASLGKSNIGSGASVELRASDESGIEAVVGSASNGRRMQVAPGDHVTIGRTDMQIDDPGLPYVSRQHLRVQLSPEGDEITVSDLYSANGTELIVVAGSTVRTNAIAQYEQATDYEHQLTPLVSGVHQIEKSQLADSYWCDMLRNNEDAYLNDAEIGLFGVFDGVGGSGGGDIASQLASDTLQEWGRAARYRQNNTLSPDTMQAGLLRAMQDASDQIRQYNHKYGTDACTTATVAQYVERPDGQYLVWGSMGDSRLYVVRQGDDIPHQLSQDEGEGRMLCNAMGSMRAHSTAQQGGVYRLQPGDRVALVTDGVTGDYDYDALPAGELQQLVCRAASPESAAKLLVDQACKRDDRTAVVFEVPARQL